VLILDVRALPDDGRPLLLIDVDGVLNVINRSQSQKTYEIFRAGATEKMSQGFTVRFRRELSGWLAELGEHFHLVWCTTWDHMANTELTQHLGLPHLPVIPTFEASNNQGCYPGLPPLIHWKTPAVIQYVGERPFAWIDDDFSPVDQDWARRRTLDIAPTNNFPIRPSQGLQRFQVNRLIAWAASVRES
jgi:hypothetical protein